ncbi:MAG: LON peptidase substrate-binding domain-containing protein [Planctomycetes bacterium]|nr:LON peptidase substrate-binding domain-containing protein [Planctomycetota bacterium]
MSGELPVFFPGQAPIFALPGTVLFPGSRLPLHIFEPRYREMVKRALETDRLVAIALLKPGWEGQYDGNPEIYPMATVGQIIMEQVLPDGRYNIVIEGLVRFQHGEIVQEKPYRIARGELLHDKVDPLEEESVRTRAMHLNAVVAKLGEADFNFAAMASRAIKAGLEPGRLADVVAAGLDVDVSVKQRLLDETNVGRRLDALVAALKAKISDIEASKRRTEEGDKWRWN